MLRPRIFSYRLGGTRNYRSLHLFGHLTMTRHYTKMLETILLSRNPKFRHGRTRPDWEADVIHGDQLFFISDQLRLLLPQLQSDYCCAFCSRAFLNVGPHSYRDIINVIISYIKNNMRRLIVFDGERPIYSLKGDILGQFFQLEFLRCEDLVPRLSLHLIPLAFNG